MPKTYRVKETFATLQGEGAMAGTAAVFLRFAGCNAWTGRAKDRARDLGRTGAACAAWCDTDFVGGPALTAGGVVAAVEAAADEHPARPGWVVCTGGEPLLQLDADLVTALHHAGFRVALETNGSLPAFGLGLNWVCVSPKWLDGRWVQRAGDELKLVVPSYDPDHAMSGASGGFRHWFVQPLDEGDARHVGAALNVVRRDPRWRLSLQTHKLLGLR